MRAGLAACVTVPLLAAVVAGCGPDVAGEVASKAADVKALAGEAKSAVAAGDLDRASSLADQARAEGDQVVSKASSAPAASQQTARDARATAGAEEVDVSVAQTALQSTESESSTVRETVRDVVKEAVCDQVKNTINGAQADPQVWNSGIDQAVQSGLSNDPSITQEVVSATVATVNQKVADIDTQIQAIINLDPSNASSVLQSAYEWFCPAQASGTATDQSSGGTPTSP